MKADFRTSHSTCWRSFAFHHLRYQHLCKYLVLPIAREARAGLSSEKREFSLDVILHHENICSRNFHMNALIQWSFCLPHARRRWAFSADKQILYCFPRKKVHILATDRDLIYMQIIDNFLVSTDLRVPCVSAFMLITGIRRNLCFEKYIKSTFHVSLFDSFGEGFFLFPFFYRQRWNISACFFSLACGKSAIIKKFSIKKQASKNEGLSASSTLWSGF